MTLRGLIIPVRPGTKEPNLRGWQKATVQPEIPEDSNRAVRLEHLTDLDLDCPEAIAVAARVIEGTCAFGRLTGVGHYLFDCAAKYEVFKDTDGSTLLELRHGAGHYTVIPPSKIPRKSDPSIIDELTYACQLDPRVVTPQDLRRVACVIAAASLVIRHWPKGGRHNGLLALAGMLARFQVYEAFALRVLEEITLQAEGEIWSDCASCVRDSYAKFAAGDKIINTGELENWLGTDVVDCLRQWFKIRREAPNATERLRPEDFVAFLPEHKYFLLENSKPWSAQSIAAHVKSPNPKMAIDAWLDRHRHVDEVTWAPGRPQFLTNTLVMDSGELPREGMSTLNLYRPPHLLDGGDPTQAGPWLDHLRRIYPLDAEHIVGWIAWRVQRPDVKINHGTVLGGATRIGKDTLLVPVQAAVGAWNFVDASPDQLMGRFNGFLKAVILRVNEARDLGEANRYQLYERCKWYLASPPEYFRVDEKNLREHPVQNVVGIIFTTNHKEGGLYLPEDDARHYVAWSDCLKEEFEENYFTRLYDWYDHGGTAHVVAYLRQPSLLAGLNPKMPPPRTEAWHQIVSANRSPEESELDDLVSSLQTPDAVTVADLIDQSVCTDAELHLAEFGMWLRDRKNYRAIPHRLEAIGYVAVRNPGEVTKGLWKIGGKAQRIYAKASLSATARMEAARARAADTGFRLQPKKAGAL